MEEKESVNSSSETNPVPITYDEESGKKSSSELFNSVFPPASSVEGKDSSCFDILGPHRKQDSLFHHVCTTDKKATAGEILQGISDKDNIGRDEKTVRRNEETGTCNLSSSLYYGGQDFCSLCVPNTNTTFTSTDNYKKEVKDNSGSSTGEWWEGSVCEDHSTTEMCSLASCKLQIPIVRRRKEDILFPVTNYNMTLLE